MSRKKQDPRPSFDLASRRQADTIVVSIMDPAELARDVDTGIRWEIGSLYSPEATEAIRAGRARLALVDGEVVTASEAVVSTWLEQIIAVTKRWWIDGQTTDTIVLDGEHLVCTPENVRRVLTEFPWLYKQLEAAYLDLARFFGAPKTA